MSCDSADFGPRRGVGPDRAGPTRPAGPHRMRGRGGPGDGAPAAIAFAAGPRA